MSAKNTSVIQLQIGVQLVEMGVLHLAPSIYYRQRYHQKRRGVLHVAPSIQLQTGVQSEKEGGPAPRPFHTITGRGYNRKRWGSWNCTLTGLTDIKLTVVYLYQLFKIAIGMSECMAP